MISIGNMFFIHLASVTEKSRGGNRLPKRYAVFLEKQDAVE